MVQDNPECKSCHVACQYVLYTDICHLLKCHEASPVGISSDGNILQNAEPLLQGLVRKGKPTLSNYPLQVTVTSN